VIGVLIVEGAHTAVFDPTWTNLQLNGAVHVPNRTHSRRTRILALVDRTDRQTGVRSDDGEGSGGEPYRQSRKRRGRVQEDLEKRGDNAREASSTAQASGRKKRQATESQKANASSKKDALDDALGDLNRSTNRLRRKFDPTDKWMETKAQVETVVDDGRKINQVVARGSYGPEAARLWAVLRTGINDLARAYGVTPMAI
jgi:hypothetical protein